MHTGMRRPFCGRRRARNFQFSVSLSTLDIVVVGYAAIGR
jgi:hypothetical protein